ncbi:response regulator transcription factor [Paenibacillus soyae]|uniref:Response regulator n=1 Tax=Paenibacillus soyae TaxID=2969249 RepID=A0A9X2MVW8_9BACL|nr:response regulator [Paenibacillus soyae]MCR2804612.1 response regulator [Paenibacillus soyae]
MYKVLVIDDDALMLKYLRGLVDWRSLGFGPPLESYSSVKALELFKQEKPDVVVTDIGMPQMDGLQLAEKFKQLKPDVRIVFLTCYEEFDYVKTALRMNADDYLIKDKLVAAQLEDALAKSIGNLKREEKMEAKESYEEDLVRNLDVLKTSLFERLTRGGDMDATVQYARRLGIKWTYGAFRMSVGHIPFSSLLDRYKTKDAELLLYSVYNIASEIAVQFEGITVFRYQSGIVVLLNHKSGTAATPHSYLQSFLSLVKRQVHELLHIGIRFVSPVAELALRDMADMYRKLMRGRLELFYDNAPLSEWKPDRAGMIFYPAASGADVYGRKLEKAIAEGDGRAVGELLRAMRMEAEEQRMQPKEWIGACTGMVRTLELRFAPSARDESFYQSMEAALNADDLVGLMAWKLTGLAEPGRKPVYAPGKVEPKLQAIDRFIADHLEENVSSIDIAEYLGLNPSYFSRYFKRLTGVNFTDYVHRYKIGIAEQMLRGTEETVEIVAAKFGYYERSYFSKVFKKYTGKTPTELRGASSN